MKMLATRLSINLSNQVMISGDRHHWQVLQTYFFVGGVLSTTSRVPCGSIRIEENADIFTAAILKTSQLTLKQCRWINSATDKRNDTYF